MSAILFKQPGVRTYCMNSFAEREKERAEGLFRQSTQRAEIENVCIDQACELIKELETYLRQKSPKIILSRMDNVVTLAHEDGRTLRVSTHDHGTYEVLGASAISDERRRMYLSRIDKRQMMDEVLDWLATPAA